MNEHRCETVAKETAFSGHHMLIQTNQYVHRMTGNKINVSESDLQNFIISYLHMGIALSTFLESKLGNFLCCNDFLKAQILN